MEWTREKIDDLIELYPEQELLWNPTNGLYKHKVKKADAWRAISEGLMLDRTDDEKVKILIPHFRRELGKKKKSEERKSGEGSENPYVNQWVFFRRWLFLAEKTPAVYNIKYYILKFTETCVDSIYLSTPVSNLSPDMFTRASRTLLSICFQHVDNIKYDNVVNMSADCVDVA